MGWAVEVMAERAEEAFCERHGIQPDGATGRRDYQEQYGGGVGVSRPPAGE